MKNSITKYVSKKSSKIYIRYRINGKIKDEQLNQICLLDKDISFGMIDYVLYKNNKQIDDKQYKSFFIIIF